MDPLDLDPEHCLILCKIYIFITNVMDLPTKKTSNVTKIGRQLHRQLDPEPGALSELIVGSGSVSKWSY
jgi:hypothetical protein